MNTILHTSFQNLHLAVVQNEIKQLCQGKSGVYRITNLKNKKNYIGSAITKKSSCNRLYFRFRDHFFNHHKELPLKRAIKKYGIQHFSWEILEFTEPVSTRESETGWIQKLKPEYNVLESASSSFGYRHTVESLQKMKAGYSESRRKRIGDLNRGKKVSREFREKVVHFALHRTPEQKERHKQACLNFNRKTFSKPTQVLDGNDLRILGTYQSLREACLAWNGDYRTFKRIVKSGQKHTKLNIYVKYSS